MLPMFLRCKKRRKDGKEHHYSSIVEIRRITAGASYSDMRSISVNSTEHKKPPGAGSSNASAKITPHRSKHPICPKIKTPPSATLESAFPKCALNVRANGEPAGSTANSGNSSAAIHFGAQCHQIPQPLVLYRLIDLGSEWCLHRHWFDNSALADCESCSKRG